MNRRRQGGWKSALVAGCLFLAGTTAQAMSCGEVAADATRIAVAGGSLTEILYELGEEQRIVAVDRTATYPDAAQALPQIGYVRDLSAEGILSLEPTLVLGEHDMGPPEVVAQLESLGVDMLIVPESFDTAGVAEKIRCVAAAVGNPSAGETLVASTLAPLEKQTGTEARGVVLLGVRGGAPLAAGRNTSGHGLLTMAGLDNAMRDIDGWKGVSEEAMLLAAPDFIVITQRGLDDAGGMQALLAHPALRLTPAAQNRRIIAMDGMAMLGFGPRTLATAAALRAELEAIR
ncbi:heme/hemin ABC transporter substrate-binding protein [Chromatocurvus halotolerans]|uniref:heme/hemin ABC transporter substrate-binding protein n=1 Tax=Chromatocurvus halotolerans TaxID=1132028 RepID=UPI00104E985E|nr:ABC transporter substrate-binding protein [Chromatocurvus halotolerans]